MPTPTNDTQVFLRDICNAVDETNRLLRNLIGELRQLRQLAEPWVASSRQGDPWEANTAAMLERLKSIVEEDRDDAV